MFKNKRIHNKTNNETNDNPNTKHGLTIFAKILLILLTCILIAAISSVGILFFYFNSKLEQIEYSSLSKEDLDIDPAVDNELSDYRNIALLGIDARSDTFSPGNRSDCIMIISINKTNNNVKIASVYRDMYLNIDNRGLDKVNHAYSFGGPQLALDTLNKNLDLNISEFVAINFDSVRYAVDSVGGVTMEIDSEETKYINRYLNSLNTQFGTSSPNITKAGVYTLDGVQALSYGRIRYTSGGDYKRTERMRDVLLAVFNKAKNMDIATLNKLLDSMLPHVYTNISKTQILNEIPRINSYTVQNNFGWPDVDMVDGKKISGIWYGVPINLEKSVSKLHEDLFNQKDYVPSEQVKSISSSIIKKTQSNLWLHKISCKVCFKIPYSYFYYLFFLPI